MNNEFRRNAILGALVADAASLGLHWVYDQQRIKDLAPQSPEFCTPSAKSYEGGAGFFAHESKQAGDLSQYGEQLMVLLESLRNNKGIYSKKQYEKSYQAAFGYGGSYSGYIDHPTRDSLDHHARAEFNALERVKAIPFKGDKNAQHMMITKALGNLNLYEGEERRRGLEDAVRLTHDEDETVEYAFKILTELESIDEFHGADDEQLPAISKIPALLAAQGGVDALSAHVESAVRVTNNNDKAVDYGIAAVGLLTAANEEKEMEDIVSEVQNSCSINIADLIKQVCELRNEETSTVTKKFGASCHLDYGFPSIIHNLLTSQSYESAVKNNIYASGDSCGRAILLGAVLGGVYGVGGDKGIPESWIKRVSRIDLIEQTLNELLTD